MQFNPISKRLYTDDGTLIKQLHCPLKMKWNALTLIKDITIARECMNCSNQVIDTAFFSDDELVTKVKSNTELCLKVNINQSNLKLFSDELL